MIWEDLLSRAIVDFDCFFKFYTHKIQQQASFGVANCIVAHPTKFLAYNLYYKNPKVTACETRVDWST